MVTFPVKFSHHPRQIHSNFPAPSVFSRLSSHFLCLNSFLPDSCTIFCANQKTQLVSFQSLAHSFVVFCSYKKINSRVFNRFQTFCRHHPGWGYPCTSSMIPYPLIPGPFRSGRTSISVRFLDLSPLFATLTKTAGVWGYSSHSGTRHPSLATSLPPLSLEAPNWA